MRRMFTQTLALHWKATRWALLPFVVLGFGVPLAALRSAQDSAAQQSFSEADALITTLQMWITLFPVTAALLGVTVGLAAWTWDHKGSHVYALALPVARWEYAVLKFAAGVALLLVPVAAVLSGVLLGLVGFDIPQGLHAYPFAFTIRFFLAALIAYAACFALAAGTMRTALWVLSAFLGLLFFGTVIVGFLREAVGLEYLPMPTEVLHRALLEWPGPFHVFGGNWMPIDV